MCLLSDAGWADDLWVEPDAAEQNVWVARVAGEDGHQADYRFDFAARTVHLELLSVIPDAGDVRDTKIGLGGGWGRWKFGRLIDGWALAGFTTCRIKRAAGNVHTPGWTGYYVWPRFGFAGRMSGKQHARLPDGYRGSRDIQTLLAKQGGRDVWKRFGGVLHHLTFDLRPGSASRTLFQDF